MQVVHYLKELDETPSLKREKALDLGLSMLLIADVTSVFLPQWVVFDHVGFYNVANWTQLCPND